ncbi:ABC transporter ATP-binding protein [Jejuia spongiicola]|uniref:ABC transporter ATP-binding protein n=1 Tax=Jejuia spongiicola TaxID=2942207 RepID=A0ABT0QCE9_9FLAO|nr:ABC transporter ATP-binding protein [Jejuia spongiicola]MCL6294662.1 ABC transporter ATP-binding protein [Jejuia spongiicola]
MIENKVILKAKNISKQYRLGVVGTGTISHDLNRWWSKLRGKEDPYLKVGESNDRSVKGESQYVWALQDINFEVKKGDVLGIIGKNGAGKSTLLKILSKVTGPTTGEIKTKGRIASLLEVGTGFHPEMTGRENIYLNGAILGMTKKEIASKINEIIEFSGCKRYIDTPVKRYSSGMTVRLAFAVAAHLEPEILVIDEVLAVGDAEFQKKAIGKMQSISQSDGRTVLFVSHNMAAVKSLCSNAIVLEHGKVVYRGSSENAVDYYLNESAFSNENSGVVSFENKEQQTQITRVETLKSDNSGASNFLMGEPIKIKISVINKTKLNRVKASIIITSANGIKIFALRSNEMTNEMFSANDDFTFIVSINSLKLMPNNYFLTIALAASDNTIEILEQCISFAVVENDVYKTGRIPKGKLITYSNATWELN